MIVMEDIKDVPSKHATVHELVVSSQQLLECAAKVHAHC